MEPACCQPPQELAGKASPSAARPLKALESTTQFTAGKTEIQEEGSSLGLAAEG